MSVVVRRRMACLALIVALLGGIFSYGGYAMVEWFLEAGAAPEPRLRTMAAVYLTACGVCPLIAIVGLGVLVHTRGARDPGPAI